jgi:hypothetical protein
MDKIKHCINCHYRHTSHTSYKCVSCGGMDNKYFKNWKIAEFVSNKDIEFAVNDQNYKRYEGILIPSGADVSIRFKRNINGELMEIKGIFKEDQKMYVYRDKAYSNPKTNISFDLEYLEIKE